METINHECYVSLEVAKLLKEAGFDWKCKLYFSELINAPKEAGIFDAMTNKVYGVFDSTIIGIGNPAEDDILMPTIDVAQRWLREIKNISVDIVSNKYGYFEFRTLYINVPNNTLFSYICASQCKYYTYEEAQEAGIKKVLEIMLKKGE